MSNKISYSEFKECMEGMGFEEVKEGLVSARYAGITCNAHIFDGVLDVYLQDEKKTHTILKRLRIESASEITWLFERCSRLYFFLAKNQPQRNKMTEENTTLDELTEAPAWDRKSGAQAQYEKEIDAPVNMDYTGAVIALEEGKHVRRAAWREWGYYLKKEGVDFVLVEGAESSKWGGPLAPEREATDWEIVT